MDTTHNALTPAIEEILQSHDGPLTVAGQAGEYVVMRIDVYDAMLGISKSDEADTLASVLRGIADTQAGRTHRLEEVFDSLEARHANEKRVVEM